MRFVYSKLNKNNSFNLLQMFFCNEFITKYLVLSEYYRNVQFLKKSVNFKD